MSNDKKICIVASFTPPNFGGAGLRAYRYAKRLESKNRLAFILTRKSAPDSKEKFRLDAGNNLPSEKILRVPAKFHGTEIRSHNIIKYGLPFIIQQIHLFTSILWNILRKRKSFDILHCFELTSWLSLYAVAIAKVLGKKTITEMTLLGSDDPMTFKTDAITIRAIFRLWLSSRVDAFVSISPALSAAYRLSTFPDSKLWEIPNSVDSNRFYPSSGEERLEFREKFHIQGDRIVILSVGSIIKRKGIDLLIDSFAIIKEKYPDALLILVGPNASRESRLFAETIRERARILNIADNVILTGLVDNVDEYMKAGDLYLFLSRREGFGSTMIEAMSTGLPVVALDIPGITEYIIQHGIDGIIVKEDNPSKIASTAIRLLGDRPLYETISKNAVKTVSKRFSTRSIDQKYQRIYEHLFN